MPITEDPEPRPSGEEPDPFENLVLDEEFVKGATVKEQSGRTRMLTARWKKNPPEPVPHRDQQPRPTAEIGRRRFGRKAVRLDPWGNKPRSRKVNWQGPVFVVLAVAVVLAGLNVNGLHDWYTRNFGGGQGADAVAPAKPVVTQAPETAQPTAAPPSQDIPETPTVAHPWIGSPAESWPVGADAIQPPPAQAVGVFSADQVAAQLQVVKQFLVESSIDPAVLAGGRPDAALALLNPSSRKVAEQELDSPSTEHNPTNLFSRFNPRTAVPATNDVHLQGRMTFESDGEKGMVVHVDYTFVYALAPGPDKFKPLHGASPSSNSQSVALAQLDPFALITREIVRREADYEFRDPDKYVVEDGKISLSKWLGTRDNNYCDSDDGWLEPEFPDASGESGPGPSASGSPVDPYDRSKPIPEDTGGPGCGTISRS
ncbi:hypothetical protein [Kitasatospora viridis]|uniref:SCO2583/SCO2584 N-terminal domain-containing protein n=1 Tax=Kitasatospora viridis TaxID=281105 RepID=UPI0011A30E61|nr:hypothetical protein [Kitasatospora viridis]